MSDSNFNIGNHYWIGMHFATLQLDKSCIISKSGLDSIFLGVIGAYGFDA
ncbi:hypothetical protein SAMN05443144_105144 [Fodinibius roseus]|uniref:Uncharacterized protein n=1 Tax=Fodinibius roseus TaxID=1194090 RepID=A0A1M4YSM1_9BACT|nr:hypothetical protein [Fodinibius roseus]SHF08731.1 hypothetical protein SAMN05443144_105144 [Fodinibius roseus]